MCTVKAFRKGAFRAGGALDPNGEPMLLSADVAAMLGFRNAGMLSTRLDPRGKRIMRVESARGPHDRAFLDEQGFYDAVSVAYRMCGTDRAKRAKVTAYADWVIDEVLPALKAASPSGNVDLAQVGRIVGTAMASASTAILTIIHPEGKPETYRFSAV